MRESISANEILSITLCYLTTGESFSRLRYSGVMGKSTISGIVQETSEAIITALKDYIKVTINKVIISAYGNFVYLFDKDVLHYINYQYILVVETHGSIESKVPFVLWNGSLSDHLHD